MTPDPKGRPLAEPRLETAIVVGALATVTVITLVVVGAWSTSGNGSDTTTTQSRPHVTTHAALPPLPHAYLQIIAVNGSSYVAVHRGGPSGRLLFQGTIEKGRVEPFKGKNFWLNVSTPENLRVIVGGKTVPLTGYTPVALTVTANGVHAD